MRSLPLYLRSVGMACPVGLRWPPACAAIRAGITRKQELPYVDNERRPLIGSYLSRLDWNWTPEQRWMFFLACALKDAMEGLGRDNLHESQLVIALPRDADGSLYTPKWVANELSARLEFSIAPDRLNIVAQGACGGFRALAMAREILDRGDARTCIAAAADSLVNARTLLALEQQHRLHTEDNSDGVIPGEAAACLVASSTSARALATIHGIGFGREPALFDNDIPLRGEGIVAAARAALAEAGLAMQDLDFRVSDAAGEGYAFKEQALVVTRLLRQRKEKFPLWLCAEILGDTGAAAGLCGVATAIAGFQRQYAPGPRAIAFAGNELGDRAALVVAASAR